MVVWFFFNIIRAILFNTIVKLLYLRYIVTLVIRINICLLAQSLLRANNFICNKNISFIGIEKRKIRSYLGGINKIIQHLANNEGISRRRRVYQSLKSDWNCLSHCVLKLGNSSEKIKPRMISKSNYLYQLNCVRILRLTLGEVEIFLFLYLLPRWSGNCYQIIAFVAYLISNRFFDITVSISTYGLCPHVL